MLKKKNIYEILGSDKINSLNSINLDKDHKPINAGNSQWIAIEAAKVLLDDKYKAVSIFHISRTSDDDPIEAYFGLGDKAKVPYSMCEILDDLEELLDKLNNNELYIINGESEEVDHAYIVIKTNNRFFLIDADRGVYKEVQPNKPDDMIYPIAGWKIDHLEEAKLDYVHLRFLGKKDKPGKEEVKTLLNMYKLTYANMDLLKTIAVTERAKEFTKITKELILGWRYYIENKKWTIKDCTIVLDSGRSKKIPYKLNKIWVKLQHVNKEQNWINILEDFIELVKIGSHRDELKKFFNLIKVDLEKHQMNLTDEAKNNFQLRRA